MNEIIASISRKGGSGKTTTALCIADQLRRRGKSVLIIDLDAKRNASKAMGADLTQASVINLFDGAKLAEVVQHTSNGDIVPGSIYLNAADSVLTNNHELRKALQRDGGQYDFIIIDCPPALGMLTINAMTAADTVLVPIQCEYYALEGLSQLIYTIDLIKKKLNKNLEIEGVVFTMYDSRTNLSEQVVENVRENLDEIIYDTLVPRNVRLAEAPSFGQPINVYDSRCAGAEAYRSLADEVIKNKLFVD